MHVSSCYQLYPKSPRPWATLKVRLSRRGDRLTLHDSRLTLHASRLTLAPDAFLTRGGVGRRRRCRVHGGMRGGATAQ